MSFTIYFLVGAIVVGAAIALDLILFDEDDFDD
jgi:hypothetical protein